MSKQLCRKLNHIENDRVNKNFIILENEKVII
jgi:hypothetical protein